jgi:hypothetical protein
VLFRMADGKVEIDNGQALLAANPGKLMGAAGTSRLNFLRGFRVPAFAGTSGSRAGTASVVKERRSFPRKRESSLFSDQFADQMMPIWI